MFDLLSLATRLMMFEPGLSATARLQRAVPAPVAVSPAARDPLTVTDEMPLLPRPASVAVPAKMIELAETTCPLIWLVIVRSGGVVSDDIFVKLAVSLIGPFIVTLAG